MKTKLFTIINCLLLSALAGCQSFPDYLVGTWKAENSKWILTFAPDGQIESMTHYNGKDFIITEGGLREDWGEGLGATYILGPCTAQYDHHNRQLDVNINIEHFRVDFHNGSVEGDMIDRIWGPVSKDGKTWTADWENGGHIKQAQPGTPDMTVVNKEIFRKISDPQK